MGKLGEQLRNEGRPRSNRFRIEEILDEMNEEDRKDLVAAIKNDEIKIAAIARVLRRNGHKVSENAIRHYREFLNVVG